MSSARETTPLLAEEEEGLLGAGKKHHHHHGHDHADEHDHAHTGAGAAGAHGGGGHGHGHSHGSMNMRALVLHVMGDALGNVGVIATGLIIWKSTWEWKFYCDPVISLIITIIIFTSAMPLGELSLSSF